MAFAPIFIVGVPRSGTTLLRVLLDSHSEIAALPETPWLLGAYGPEPSLRGVLQGLIEGRHGAVHNVKGVEPDHILAAGRAFLATMFEPVLRARGKRVLAFKTPADIRHLDFLLKLVPDAFYIHITRDGRDVAMSQLAKKGSFFDDLKEYRRIGFANLLQRWAEWERRIRALLYRDGVRAVHVKYEDLIAAPARELERITAFLGVPFEAGMLDYASMDHDYPSWEAGSTDVARHEGVSGASAGKWRQARITAEMLHALMKHDHFLVELGYEPSGIAPDPARRALAGIFALMSPVLDMAARVRLLLRPFYKTRARLLACLSVALLAAQFLVPGSWPQTRDLAADIYQPVLWFAVALGFAWAFGSALLRRAPGAHRWAETFLRCWACMAAAAGILELAQNVVPERHARIADFLLNAAGAALALLVGLAFFRGGEFRIVRGHSRARQNDRIDGVTEMAAGTILYASYVSPFPPHSGERIRALNLIAAFRALGFRVEAIVGNFDGIELESQNRDGVRFHRIPFAWPRLRQAVSTYFRPNRIFVEQVCALHRANALTAIVLDYGFMGAQIEALSRLGIPVLLGTHNLESALTGQVRKGSFAANTAIRLRQAIECAHERLFFRKADAVLCVSDEDRRAYARFLREDRLHVVPNFIDVADCYADVKRENRIIMTGSFGNFQNVDGLRWFVNEVWDESLHARTSLCVAGRLSDRAGEEFAHISGIVALGAREDLLGEMARSRAAIVPLWHGGGTRLKCLEAMATRTPVITTSKGCEGIRHRGAFRVADDAASFRAAILEVLDNPGKASQDASRARAIFDSDYSLAANAARLQRALESAEHAHAARGMAPVKARGTQQPVAW